MTDNKEEILHRAYRDLIYFGRVFLPNDFLHKSETPAFHHEIAKKLISSKPGARICNILPRGFAKSTLAKAAILHKICFAESGRREFIAWVSEEQGQSIDHLKYIKYHLEMNQAIRHYFGDLLGEKWTEKDIVTSKGDRIIAKGTTQRLRGRTEVDVRYTGIVLDDFESELNTKTPDRRSEIKKWVMSTIYPALEETPGREGWIWLQGTIVHYDSFLQSIYDGWRESQEKCLNNPWDVAFYRATIDGTLDSEPLWPEQFPIKKLRSKLEGEFRDSPDKFAQEYMNDARDISSASFKIDRIQKYHGDFVSENGFAYLHIGSDVVPIYVYLGVDIAATATSSSDHQVIIVMGIDSERNRYVIDYFRERIPAFDLAPKIVEMAKKYSPVRRVTIETVAAQEIVRDMAERLAAKDRKLVPGIMKGIKHPTRISKEDRLETALGWIVNSKKLYTKHTMTELTNEFFEHPRSKHDDIMDALYCANYHAKPPRSNRMKEEEFSSHARKGAGKTKRRYNWLTGARY